MTRTSSPSWTRAHARDLNVILDGAFNHVGRDFAPFRDVLARGATSSWANWFRLDGSGDGGDGFTYGSFERHAKLIALNHDNPSVLGRAGDVARHWVTRGADGWRLDAAYAIPTAFTRSLTGAICDQRGDALVFAEMIHRDYAGFVATTGVDSVTQYELHTAIWSSWNDANFYELAWSLDRHRRLRQPFAPVTFVGNHDATRLASHLGDPWHLDAALGHPVHRPRQPCVYYGDEFAGRGVKEQRAGGDDAIRPVLPSTPDPVDREKAQALRLHRELIGFRRARPWLTDADIEVVDLGNRKITCAVTGAADALLTTVHVDLTDAIGPPPGRQLIVSHPGVAICERAPRHA
jgi:cyclomaltodextrinase / maltogenic alpha-amylase / neopullulanase